MTEGKGSTRSGSLENSMYSQPSIVLYSRAKFGSCGWATGHVQVREELDVIRKDCTNWLDKGDWCLHGSTYLQGSGSLEVVPRQRVVPQRLVRPRAPEVHKGQLVRLRALRGAARGHVHRLGEQGQRGGVLAEPLVHLRRNNMGWG